MSISDKATGNDYTSMLFPISMLSSAAFLYQIALMRLFPITHFYHFAFMIIALALLGSGASGSLLAIVPQLSKLTPRFLSRNLCFGCGFSILFSFLLINHIPFNAYAVAIDNRQFYILLLHFLSLSAPFFCLGLLVSTSIKKFPEKSHILYAFNLVGSAAGCISGPFLLPLTGGERIVLICVVLALLSSLAGFFPFTSFVHRKVSILFPSLLMRLALIVVLLSDVFVHTNNGRGHSIFDVYISPYKALSYALQYPGARITDTRWNAFSRVDIVRSEGIRSLPGLSYLYPGLVEAAAGVFVDGSDMNALLPVDSDLAYSSYLPQALAYQLRPRSQVLILGSHAGQDVLTASAQGADQITAVEPNKLLIEAADNIYNLPQVHEVAELPRVFLNRTQVNYDVITIPLTSSYYPVTSGAYSLGEDYRYTIESFQTAISRLKPNGILVVNRWLQMPPSEFLRTFIIAVESLEGLGLDATCRIAALRGYNLGILFINRSCFLQSEFDDIKKFAQDRAFDLVYLPGLLANDANRFNVLQEDEYYESFKGFLTAEDRTGWMKAYPYRVDAPTDDHPFFMHFFKWSQLDQILETYGKTWQPFGGAGILVMFFLLIVMLFLSGFLILLPVFLNRVHTFKNNHSPTRIKNHFSIFGFFLMIGIGYMAVEIPIIQRFILYLGQPEYAMSVVLFTLLMASGFGSRMSQRVSGVCILGLVFLILLLPWWLTWVFEMTIHWQFYLRILIAIFSLAPLGFLMGIPLAKGISVLSKAESQHIAWAWAINGTASVLASVISALIALTYSFSHVLLLGALSYLSAYFFFRKLISD